MHAVTAASPAAHRRCYAIRCKNASFKDGHGREVNRQGACYNEVRTVKVQITDDCPCAYKGNPLANQQWW
jgi:hypothetical protein